MKKTQSGFTLIEIAIVLVIIGLLLGGVLKGQELIDSARTRSLINKVDGLSAAWFAFQDRYRAIPGDMTVAQAQAQIDPGITHGGVASNGNVNTNSERGGVWEQLSAAGFLSGSLIPGDVAGNFNCVSPTCPDNGFGRGFVITFANREINGNGNKNQILSEGIPSKVLADMDRKTDDGNNETGDMRSPIAGAGVDNTCQGTAGDGFYALNVESCGAVWNVLN